jgi:hypothetical protein
MKPVVILLLIAACLLAVTACSDDKSTSSSGSSRDDDDDKPSRSKNKGNTAEDRDDSDEDDSAVKDDTVKTNPDATATPERGFKDSKQPESASADGTEIVANKLYEGGERLKVSSLGFSFQVPKDEKAYFPQGGSLITVGAQGADAKFLTLIMAQTGATEADARDMMSKAHDLGGGDQLKRTGEIEKNGDRLSCPIATARMVGRLEMLIGKSTGVAVATLGLPGSESDCKSKAGKLADSIKFATPAGEKQRLEHEAGLMGKRCSLFYYKGSSDYSHSSETNKDWHFGSDHTYDYIYRNTNSSTFKDGGGYASDNNDNHSGTWSIELTLGFPMLVLRASDGRIFTYTLTVVKNWLHFNGEELSSFGASDRKR